MYQEEIAKITADHLRTHIEVYLAEEAANHNDQITLVMPKKIEVASAIGGSMAEYDKILPSYAVDIMEKSIWQGGPDLHTYVYDGHISGLLGGNSQDLVDKLCKRHSSAVEHFVKQHLYLHEYNSDQFTIVNFIYLGSTTTGAELLSNENDRELWFDGFRVDTSWIVSEGEGYQHG